MTSEQVHITPMVVSRCGPILGEWYAGEIGCLEVAVRCYDRGARDLAIVTADSRTEGLYEEER